jgi:hypothetical protein
MTNKDKMELIQFWSNWFYNYTNSYKGSLALSLAYLWPAIVNGNQIEVSSRSTIVQVLKHNGVSANASIWRFIDIVG